MHWQTMAMCDVFITDALIRLSRACADAHADPRVNEALPDDPDGFKNVLRADMEREDEEKAEKAARENVQKEDDGGGGGGGGGGDDGGEIAPRPDAAGMRSLNKTRLNAAVEKLHPDWGAPEAPEGGWPEITPASHGRRVLSTRTGPHTTASTW